MIDRLNNRHIVDGKTDRYSDKKTDSKRDRHLDR